MSVVRLSSKGQVVIPKGIREQLGLNEGERLKILIQNRRITLVPAKPPPRDLLVRGDRDAVMEISKKAKTIDEDKVRRLLSALGVKH